MASAGRLLAKIENVNGSALQTGLFLAVRQGQKNSARHVTRHALLHTAAHGMPCYTRRHTAPHGTARRHTAPHSTARRHTAPHGAV